MNRVAHMTAGITVSLLLSAIPSAAAGRPVYGQDDRRDLWQVTDPGTAALADASVALFPDTYVTYSPDGLSARLFTESYAQAYRVCPEEPFYEQRVGPFCSGALVGPDLVLTAAHCVVSMENCAATRFIFGFAVKEPGKVPDSVPVSQVYSCAAVAASQHYGGADWALIRLDRRVVDHTPLKIAVPGGIKPGDGLLIIGYPSGLPLKVAGGARVRAVGDGYFTADMDSYSGNSGSPVFNAVTRRIEGVLVRGEADYVFRNGCALSRVCAQDGCEGEQVSLLRGLPPAAGRAAQEPISSPF